MRPSNLAKERGFFLFQSQKQIKQVFEITEGCALVIGNTRTVRKAKTINLLFHSWSWILPQIQISLDMCVPNESNGYVGQGTNWDFTLKIPEISQILWL